MDKYREGFRFWHPGFDNDFAAVGSAVRAHCGVAVLERYTRCGNVLDQAREVGRGIAFDVFCSEIGHCFAFASKT